MTDADKRIEDLAKRFVVELQAIARDELMQILGGAVGGRRVSDIDGRGPGAKRSPERLEELQQQVVAYVKAHPGQRVEEINAGLGTSTAELALPIRKLLASKAIKTTGTRRATRYFPAGAGKPAAGRAPKRTRAAKKSARRR